jgi:hypothetical protein
MLISNGRDDKRSEGLNHQLRVTVVMESLEGCPYLQRKKGKGGVKTDITIASIYISDFHLRMIEFFS